MITEKMITDNFEDVQRMDDDIIKFKELLPDFKDIYYLGFLKSDNINIIVISRNIEDDVFASELIRVASSQNKFLNLLKFRHNIENKYGFDSALMAGSQYHSYFKGRLDDVRDTLYLCLPIFECEFSGNESVKLFYEMRRFLIKSLNWNRSITPRIMLRFENPKTKAGTIGKNYYPVDFNVVKTEIINLNGVPNGVVEILNYRDEYVNIISISQDRYILKKNGKILCDGYYSSIEENLWKFLIQG
jgi:hypothetical protein